MIVAEIPSTPERRSSRTAVGLAGTGVAILTVVWRFLTFTGFNNDHYIYLAGAQQMVLGEWPIRDFVDPGWPLMYAVSAIARFMFGRELWVELAVVSGAFAIGAALTIAAATRLSGSVAIAIAVTLLEILINPRSFGYPKILLYALAGWAFVESTRSLTRGRVLLLAALTAVAFLFRHDHALYIGPGAIAAIVLGSWHQGARTAMARAALFTGAVVVLLVPWALFVQYHIGFADYLRPALEFSRAEAEATVVRHLPRIEPGALWSAANREVWLFYLFHSMPFACVWLAWQRSRTSRQAWSGESAAVAAVGVMAIAMNLGFIRTPLAARLPDAVVPAALLGSWLLGLAWRAEKMHSRSLALATAAIMFVITASAVNVVADVPGELNRAGILNRRGALPERIDDLRVRLRKVRPERSHIPSRNSEALMPFYAFLDRCSAPGDRIVMTGLSPDVFVLANRGFAGGQMAFRPSFYTNTIDQQRALTRFQAQSVPFVIVALEEERGFRQEMPLIASYVDEHYDTLALIPVPETKGLQLYVERGRRAAGRDAATGWPCFPNQ